jgi:hypothetical protein
MANEDRGEIEIEFNPSTQVLMRFRAAESALLDDLLGAAPLVFLGRGGGTEKFLINAFIAGTSQTRRKDRVSPGQAAAWLDEADPSFNREDCKRDVLYALARGKGGDEAKRMCDVLDEIYRPGPKEDDDKKKAGSASAAA